MLYFKAKLAFWRLLIVEIPEFLIFKSSYSNDTLLNNYKIKKAT